MSSSTTRALLSSPIQQRLDSEFPVAAEVPADTHRFSPSTIQPSTVFRFPGITHESTRVVRQLMEENDRRFHIYQRISYQHNHLPHHLLTAYSLGATPKHLEAIFEDNVDDMAPIDRDVVTSAKKGGEAKQSTIRIDSSNWHSDELLGKKSNYAAYLAFFHSEIERIGGKACFDQYLFSSQANTQGKGNHQGPRMFYRFMAGIFHPFIHTGFGIEFKDQVMLAEGLAQAAVHSPDIVAALFPPDWPNTATQNSSGPATSTTESPFSTTKLKPTRLLDHDHDRDHVRLGARAEAPSHPGLLELYAELCANETLRPGPYDPNLTIDRRMRAAIAGDRAGEVQKIANKWAVNEDELVFVKEYEEPPSGGEVVNVRGWGIRVDELQVLATLLAAATGRPGREPRVDFFLMHCLTSSIFLPSFMQYLQPAQRAVLLKSYLLVVFHTALSRGRPLIRPEVLLQYSVNPAPPSQAEHGEESGKAGGDVDVDVTGDPKHGGYGNPWLAIVDNCMYSKDSHVMKSIRALLLYSMKYGHLSPGHLPGSQIHRSPDEGNEKESIPGISALGGDIFVRAAGVVMRVMGWAGERKPGEKEGWWDTSALGWDDAWK